jgi:BirA family transcriptional regulator, biotin operon repressor / biotin---[acetyl-CoA-carboxylase] ligase
LRRHRIGTPRRHVEECESTQLLLGPDDPEGAIATTDHQTGGRGRRGRSWVESPGTSVLCSVLLRPPPELPAPQLSLVGGLAAAIAAEETLGLAAQIKWPNDVMVNRRKVAGVLAEARDGVVILGIGVNVNQTPGQLPADARVPAASLRTLDGRLRDREEVLALLLGTLDGLYARWREGGLEALYDDLGARDFLRGRRVSVDGVEGTAQMILRDGRLEVSTAAGPVVVESGEVVYRG